MKVRRHRCALPRFGTAMIERWRSVSSAVASDGLGRQFAMNAAIKPLSGAMRGVGRARTVEMTPGNNLALHAAIGIAEPGDVLVCDAQGHVDTAVFGGLLCRAAMRAQIAAVVIDGAVRDSAEITDLGLPCFCIATVPRGPQKAPGGALDGPIACGGVPVTAGDLVIADADGVTIVPARRIEAAWDGVVAVMAKEARAHAQMEHGGALADLYGAPTIEWVDDAGRAQEEGDPSDVEQQLGGP